MFPDLIKSRLNIQSLIHTSYHPVDKYLAPPKAANHAGYNELPAIQPEIRFIYNLK